MEGLQLSVSKAPDSTLVAEILVLVARAEQASGHPALSEHKRMTLASSPPPSDLVGGVVARIGSALVGYAPVVVDSTSGQYAMEVVVDPTADDRASLSVALIGATIQLVKGSGGGDLRLWTSMATEADDVRARDSGFDVERNLLQMRCALPLPDQGSKNQAALDTRPFRPGTDEAAWLTTNNRAFATHPEQGHWDMATLLQHEQEPWFDPDGFLVLEREGRVAGSCWTKIHAHTDPPMGEIYVIGVDPDFHGRGWGRGLTQAGLTWLAGRGLTVGMLYVDAANVAAVTMYRSMGFTEHHTDRAYLGHFG